MDDLNKSLVEWNFRKFHSRGNVQSRQKNHDMMTLPGSSVSPIAVENFWWSKENSASIIPDLLMPSSNTGAFQINDQLQVKTDPKRADITPNVAWSELCSGFDYQPQNAIPDEVYKIILAFQRAHVSISQASSNAQSTRPSTSILHRSAQLPPPQRYRRMSKQAHIGWKRYIYPCDFLINKEIAIETVLYSE